MLEKSCSESCVITFTDSTTTREDDSAILGSILLSREHLWKPSHLRVASEDMVGGAAGIQCTTQTLFAKQQQKPKHHWDDPRPLGIPTKPQRPWELELRKTPVSEKASLVTDGDRRAAVARALRLLRNGLAPPPPHAPWCLWSAKEMVRHYTRVLGSWLSG